MKLCEEPLQIIEPLSKCGVTVIVATTGDVPVFIALKEAISPVPDAARPTPGAEFIHVKVVVPPVLLVMKLTGAVGEPSQTTWSAGSFTCPVGLTVMVNDCVGPSQVAEPLV